MKNAEIKALALDLYNNKVTKIAMSDGNMIDANEALRKLLLEKCNGEFSYRNFRKIENEFYEILEVLVSSGTTDITQEIFSTIMDFKDTAFGEKPDFTVENPDLFEVSVIANGTDNLIRQRIFDRKVPTVSFDLGVGIYEELDAFLLGRIDFNKMIDKVVKSFNYKVVTLISKTFSEAYDSINSNELKVTGAMDKDKLIELVEKVGNGAVIFGSKLALSKIPEIKGFVTDNTDIRNSGYVRMTNGITCVELENHYDTNKGEFILPNDTLYIIPNGEKVLFGGFEGDARIIDDTTGSRLDRQIEFFYMRRFHLGIAVSNRFGAYKISK